MAATCSISMVGDKLIVGAIDTSFLSASTKVTPGTSVLNGPVFIGAALAAGVARATCMIGPSLSVGLPSSLEVQGISIFDGSVKVFGSHFIEGVSRIEGKHTTDGYNSTLGTSDVEGEFCVAGESVFNGSVEVNGELSVAGTIEAAEVFNSHVSLGEVLKIANTKKGFDIPHPTKKGYRLRYTTLEGPGVDVYYKGKLKNKNFIELPSYWKDLVREETIEVHLTPLDFYQELYVEKINAEKITIKNNISEELSCNYIVYGERKDGEKLIPEYKGLTPNDYPGDNSEYNINSF